MEKLREITKDKFILEFLNYLNHQRNAALNTVMSYARDLSEFCAYLKNHQSDAMDDGHMMLERVNPLMIRSYLSLLFQKNGATSIARKLSAMRSFFKYYVKKGRTGTKSSQGDQVPQGAQKAAQVSQCG